MEEINTNGNGIYGNSRQENSIAVKGLSDIILTLSGNWLNSRGSLSVED